MSPQAAPVLVFSRREPRTPARPESPTLAFVAERAAALDRAFAERPCARDVFEEFVDELLGRGRPGDPQ